MGRPERRDPPRAVALRYDRPGQSEPSTAAPRVVAKGRGAVAERILEIAAEHDVPVRTERDLVELLSVCELGDEIPVEVWTAVAELLAWLWGLREEPAR
jgi:flagellar biosynthesis protein